MPTREATKTRKARRYLALSILTGTLMLADAAQAQWSPGGPSTFVEVPRVLDAGDAPAVGPLLPGGVTPTDTVDGLSVTNTTFIFTADAADVGKTIRLTWFAIRDGGVASLDPLLSVTHLSGTLTWSPGMTLVDIGGASLLSTTTASVATGGGDGSTTGTASSVSIGASAITSGLPFSMTAESPTFFFPETLDDQATIRQSFNLYFTPSAPGATIALDLPSSADSRLVVVAPEPGSVSLLGLGALMGLRKLRRRPGRTP